MNPERRLPRFKDQITDHDSEDHRDRPLNVTNRPATGSRRVPVDAPPSVDHQPPPAVFPTYKDQVNDTTAEQQFLVNRTSVIATPIISSPVDINLIVPPQRRGHDGRLPDFKDQARSVIVQQPPQVREEADGANALAVNTNLPDYKDQALGEMDRRRNTSELPLPLAKRKNAKQPQPPQQQQQQQVQQPQQLPDFKDQIHSVIQPHANTTDHRRMDNVVNEPLPNYKDQVNDRNWNDNERFLPTKASRKDTNLNTTPQQRQEQHRTLGAPPQQQQMLPDYKDQVQSVLQVQQPVRATNVVVGRRVSQNTDQVSDGVDRIPALASDRALMPLPSRLPDYKDQAQSVVRVQQVQSADVVVDTNSRLPQYKDQVFGENDRVGNIPAFESDRVMVSPPTRLPDYKDQAQSVVRVQQVQQADVVVDYNSRLPQYKDQVFGENDRVGASTIPTSSDGAKTSLQSRLPEYKDQARSVLQVQQVRDTDMVQGIEPVGNLPDYKDQAIGDDDRALRNRIPVTVRTKSTDPAGTSLTKNPIAIQRRQLADADDEPPTPAVPPPRTNEMVDTNVELEERTDSATMAFAEPYVDVPVYQASDPILPQGDVSYAEGIGVLVDILFDDPDGSPQTEETPAELVEIEDTKSKYLGFRSRSTMLLAMSGVIVLIVAVTVGSVCGSGACTGNTAVARNDVVPSLAPIPLQRPSTVNGPIPFSTTNELYAAVDEFMDAFYGDNPRETDITTIYGPIADWDVSQLTNLALVFYRGDRNSWSESDLSQAAIPPNPFNEDVSRWNVSSATTLEGMLAGAVAITDLNLSAWDTRRATSMRGMFHSASSYDGNLARWNVQSVTDFSGMFAGCTAFTGQGLDVWNIESGELFTHTFFQAVSFNADLTGWNTNKLISLQGTFESSISFRGTGLQLWNVSSVTTLDSTFLNAVAFQNDLSGWDTSRVTSLRRTFENATSFNSDLPWNLAQVTTMSSAFGFASSFNGDISNWDTSPCIDMSDMFASTFCVGDVSLWNTGRVVRMNGMFEFATRFNSNVGQWNVSNVVSMSRMFRETLTFNQDLSAWDVGKVTAMDSMFQGATAFSQNLCAWGEALSSNSNSSNIANGTSSSSSSSSVWQLSEMFRGATLCESTSAPNRSNIVAGPWCAATCV